MGIDDCQKPDSRLLKFYHAKIPVTRADLSTGALEQLVRVLAVYPIFREMATAVLWDTVSFGCGYQDHADLLRNVPEAFDMGNFPNQEWQFAELIAWRLYIGKRCGLSDAVLPITVAWNTAPLQAKDAFSCDGWLENAAEKDLPRLRFGFPIDWGPALPEQQSFLLKPNERLFCTARHEFSRLVAEDYYHPGCGVSEARMVADLEKEAHLPLEDAVLLYGPLLNPPGLTFQSYYDSKGGLIGHGFSCQAVKGCLQEVFSDKESLFHATVALWRCEPVEKWAANVLPDTLFAGEFQDPWRPPRARNKACPDEQRESALPREQGLPSLPTHNGKIALGHRVILANATYTRQSHRVTIGEIDGLLGLSLLGASEVADNDCSWLLDAIPYAIDHATCACLRRTSWAFNDLTDKEVAWNATTGALDMVQGLARLTSVHATPIFAHGAAVQRRWEGRWLDHAMERADATVRRTYPALNGVGTPHLGEYALDYFGKAHLQSGASEESNIEFLQYAILRNLGLDPFYYFPPTLKEWLAIFRLVRLCLMQVDERESAAAVKSVATQAQTLWRKSGKLLGLLKELDTSCEESRISVHQHLLATSQA